MLNLALEVKENKTKGYTYYRCNLPAKVTTELGIEKGDILLVNILEVKKASTMSSGESQ